MLNTSKIKASINQQSFQQLMLKLPKLLDDRNIRFVRILWCDNANVIRAKAFHRDFLEEHRSTGIGIAMAQQAIPVMYDAIAPNSGLTPVGEAWLVPDWSTLNALPYAPGHARVMGNLRVNREPWVLCPRECLRRSIRALADDLNLQAKASFENEFYLFKDVDLLTPVDRSVFAATLGMDLNYAVINDIADALIAQEIPVERYYPESGFGQHEIAIRYTDAMSACDRQIAFRETIRGVALQHNLRASFLPKIFADSAGSGCHLHLSLWRNGENLLPSENGLSAIGRAFAAGILQHLPALMAITTPSPNSYRRLQPHFWSGAFRCWGMDNREAALRVPSNPIAPSPTHIELKTVDATANPYLAMAATISAGLDGIRQNLELGEPASQDPGNWSESERQERQIDRLPANLGEAIDHLSQDQVLLDALGADLAQAFLAVRRAEWEAMQNFSLDQEVKLLLERY